MESALPVTAAMGFLMPDDTAATLQGHCASIGTNARDQGVAGAHSILVTGTPDRPTIRIELSDQQRRSIYETLLAISKDGKTPFKAFYPLAQQYGVSERTIRRVWNRARNSLVSGSGHAVLTSLRFGRKGPTSVSLNAEAYKAIDLRLRRTIRSAANAAGVSKSVLHRKLQTGEIRRHTNAIKPLLTEENKLKRLKFALNEANSESLGPRVFADQFDRVHIDEKWFYITEESGRYYLATDEKEPYRACKSKRFVTKVMFLVAVARPRFNVHKNEIFNGKICVLLLVYQKAAKRSSKNRAVGTMETKPIESVTKEVTKRFLIEKLYPAIREKWPRSPHQNDPIKLFVQQDNARPHPDANDPELLKAGDEDGFHIRLIQQPPNIPDMNVLDLGFFRAIQSLQQQQSARNIDELIETVVKSFNDLSHEKLNDVFLTLQQCFIEVIKHRGGNDYRIPHMSKSRLRREGRNPVNIEFPADDYENGTNYWNAMQHRATT
jgi:hypothetical protein